MWRAVLAVRGAVRPVPWSRVTIVDVTTPHRLALDVEHDDDPVIVLGHVSDALAVQTACSFVAGHRPDLLVAHVVTRHAPLAAMVAMDLAIGIAADAGHCLAAFEDLEANTWSGAVLRSVTRLTDPDPSVAQYVRSWLPASRFVLRQGPHPAVASITAIPDLIGDLPRGRHVLHVGSPTADHAGVAAVVAATSPSAVMPVGAIGSWQGVYGSVEDYQLALTPRSPHRVVREPAPACQGCGLATGGANCLFCRTRTHGGKRVRDRLEVVT